MLVISPKTPISACTCLLLPKLPASALAPLIVIVGVLPLIPSAFCVPVKSAVLAASTLIMPPLSLMVRLFTFRYISLSFLIVSCGAPCAIIVPFPFNASVSILILPPDTTISGTVTAGNSILSSGTSVPLSAYSANPAFAISLSNKVFSAS